MTYASLKPQSSGRADELWAGGADFTADGSFSDALTQLALTDICGPGHALHKHRILTDFLQRQNERAIM